MRAAVISCVDWKLMNLAWRFSLSKKPLSAATLNGNVDQYSPVQAMLITSALARLLQPGLRTKAEVKIERTSFLQAICFRWIRIAIPRWQTLRCTSHLP